MTPGSSGLKLNNSNSNSLIMTITFANVKSAKGAEWSHVDKSCSWTKEDMEVTWTAEKCSQPPQELETGSGGKPKG